MRITMNDEFIHNITTMCGDAGRTWLADLPGIIHEYERRWNFRAGPPFHLSYNYVAPARLLDGSEAVLKIGFPDNPEFPSELEALRQFDNSVVVRLLEWDPSIGVILMERVRPGTPLDQWGDDEQQTSVAAGIARRMWKPAEDSPHLIRLEDWFLGFERHRTSFQGGAGPLPTELFDLGERLFAELLASTHSPMLLHGDFHHWNIIRSAERGWVVIDPKGVIGDPAYELGAYLYNPFTTLTNHPRLENVLRRRVEIFSTELDLDRRRIIRWGIAQAVLSAVWSVEDHDEVDGLTLQVARTLASLGQVDY